MEQELLDFIKQKFPEKYNSQQTYKEFIKNKIAHHLTMRATIFAEIKNALQQRNDYYKKQENRDFAKIDDESTMIKTPESIVEKMYREGLTIDNFIYKMEDILRFRIICNYLSDVYEAERIIRNTDKLKEVFQLKKRKNYIKVDPRDRARGHRALQLVFETNFGGQTILFEVQIMTMLQHAWDKKDHNLIYERIRKKERVYLGDKIKMASMSDLLYIADEFFSHLRKRMLQRRKKS